MKLPKALHYTQDDEPGISRRRRGKGYSFHYPDGRVVKEKTEKERLASLAIPPAYTDVWYCLDEMGHLQATGKDAKGRKQYRYHPDWIAWRGALKFDGLVEFGESLPKIRGAVEYALQKEPLSRDRVLGAVMKLLDKTAARIGNEKYFQENGTAGLTTLRKKNAEVSGNKIHLEYKAKTGKRRVFDLNHPTLSKIVARMEDLPGQRLFQYKDGETVHPVDSTNVNDWLKEKSGLEGISAKYFRTWHASRLTLKMLLEGAVLDTKTARIRRENEILKMTSKELGHRPPVCRKHYVHPEILKRFREGTLQEMFPRKIDEMKGLSADEERLLYFLKMI